MKTKVLVVDDSRVERLLVAGLLRKNPDYEIVTANNGSEALEKLADSPASIVITDLVMPEMDGLALIHAVRRQYPSLPVILLTAYGHETTAFEALQAGAANYVPKACQAECLLETVDRVVARSRAERNRAMLGQCVLEYHSRFLLPNDPQLIPALVEHVQQVMAGQGFGDTVERVRMGEAIEQALQNAMYHGNLKLARDEPADAQQTPRNRFVKQMSGELRRSLQSCQRHIVVVVHVTPQEVRVVVRDQGRGFNTALKPTRQMADCFERGQDRGLTLIHGLMDEVTFNATGNEVTLRKRCSTA